MKPEIEEKKGGDRPKQSGRSLAFRSRLTNGSHLLSFVDGRSQWARRFRDIIFEYESDLGGSDTLSAGQKALIRRAALLQIELEFQDSKFAMLSAEGRNPAPHRLNHYGRHANTLRRLVESLGLNAGRHMRTVNGSSREILSRRILNVVRQVPHD